MDRRRELNVISAYDSAEAPAEVAEGGSCNGDGHETNGHTPGRFSLDVLAKGCGS